MDPTDFSTFSISALAESPDDLWSLGGGVLVDLANHFGFPTKTPTVELMSEFVRTVGANKELQLNIAGSKQALGAEAYATATDLLERSGIMRPLNRSFLDPSLTLPHEYMTVITGGVANWMLRRANVANSLSAAKNHRLFLAMGSREMKLAEHPRVQVLADQLRRLPTEYDFASHFLVPDLERSGYHAKAVNTECAAGDEVLEAFFAAEPLLLYRELLVIGNAPSAIQSAGQLRIAARKMHSDFDSDGTQLFVRSDAFTVGRMGDSPAVSQNPISGLGALARAALFLVKTLN